MVYLLNKNFHSNEKVRKALTKIFGVGPFVANQVCDQLGFHNKIMTKDLTPSQIDQMTRILTQYYYTGSELKRLYEQDLQRFIQIGCYKGFRCVEGLPLRGQRTHTNAKTCRKRFFRPRTTSSVQKTKNK